MPEYAAAIAIPPAAHQTVQRTRRGKRREGAEQAAQPELLAAHEMYRMPWCFRKWLSVYSRDALWGG